MAKRKLKEVVPAAPATPKQGPLNIDLTMSIDQQFGGHKLRIVVKLTDENGAEISKSEDWVTIPV